VVAKVSRGFKDISLSFDMHPVTKDISAIKNEDAIKRSIRNIIQTLPYERFFNPLFGSNIRASLFDFIDFGTASILQQQLQVAVENFEPRVINSKVEVFPKPDENAFEINMSYDIVGQEFPVQQFTYILEATR
jgi:phage baseplate assembly protein W